VVSERMALWTSSATSTDLLWHYRNGQAMVDRYRRFLADEDVGEGPRRAVERELRSELDNLTAIVAELHRRGHNVAEVE
jgi:hypothetical protein